MFNFVSHTHTNTYKHLHTNTKHSIRMEKASLNRCIAFQTLRIQRRTIQKKSRDHRFSPSKPIRFCRKASQLPLQMKTSPGVFFGCFSSCNQLRILTKMRYQLLCINKRQANFIENLHAKKT